MVISLHLLGDSVATMSWLTEVTPGTKAGKEILSYLHAANLGANPGLSYEFIISMRVFRRRTLAFPVFPGHIAGQNVTKCTQRLGASMKGGGN